MFASDWYTVQLNRQMQVLMSYSKVRVFFTLCLKKSLQRFEQHCKSSNEPSGDCCKTEGQDGAMRKEVVYWRGAYGGLFIDQIDVGGSTANLADKSMKKSENISFLVEISQNNKHNNYKLDTKT